jgi:hypothetical protein
MSIKNPIASARDLDLLSGAEWHAKDKNGDCYYRKYDHTENKKSVRVTMLHRVIGARIAGRPITSDELVDHINGDTLNNTRGNLRIVDRFGNMQNRVSGSPYRGTTWHKCGRWQASVGKNGRTYYLGLFETREAAALAAKAKREELGFLNQRSGA